MAITEELYYCDNMGGKWEGGRRVRGIPISKKTVSWKIVAVVVAVVKAVSNSGQYLYNEKCPFHFYKNFTRSVRRKIFQKSSQWSQVLRRFHFPLSRKWLYYWDPLKKPTPCPQQEAVYWKNSEHVVWLCTELVSEGSSCLTLMVDAKSLTPMQFTNAYQNWVILNYEFFYYKTKSNCLKYP